MRFHTRAALFAALLLAFLFNPLFIVGCSGGGGGGTSTAKPAKTAWGDMKWGDGKWTQKK